MRNPITDIAGHLSWTDSGIVWATWRIEPLAYGRRPLKDKRTVRDVHRLLLRCLDGEALMLGVAVALDPVAVVERQIAGIELESCPDLAAEAEANLDRLAGLVLGERAFFLSVPLANQGRRRWSAPLSAAMGTLQDVAQLPRTHPSEDELQTRLSQAAAIQKLISAPFRPRPIGAAEQVWLTAHAVRRGMIDFPPPEAGSLEQDLIVQSGICLPEPILDEGAWADLEAGVKVRNPMSRRVLKVLDPRGTDLGQPASYQCPMVLTDTPIGGLTWPGSELLASLDDLAHDVDWAVRLRVNTREKVMAANRKALRDLNDQYDQRSDETTLGSSDLDHAAELLAEYQTIFSSDRLEVEVEHTVILTVAGATAESAMEQATGLATAMANADFRLERPVGALTELWWATQIGVPSSRSVRGWSMFTSAGRFSALVPFTSTQLGGRKGHVWGLNTSSSRTGVIHLDPGGYPELDKSGSVCLAGELGSGKTFGLKTLSSAIVAEGGQLMTIDKSNEGEWAGFATTFAGAVIVDPDDPAWSMDPLRCLGLVDGSVVAQSFVSQLLNLSPQEDEGITLAQVLDPGYLTSHHLQGLQDVMEHLESGCPLAGATDLGRRLRNYANSPLGRVVLNQGLPAVDGISDVIVWRTHSMEQPTNEEIAVPHLFRGLPITKVFGRAYYSLVTSTARRWAFADTSRVSALVCDEAYDIFSNPENARDLEHFVRQGRRPKALLLLGSHNPDRDFGTETMRSLIPTRIVMRQTDDDLARASVRWLGIAEDDPEFEVMVDQLRFQTSPAMPDRGVEPARRGECFIRDAFGGIGSAKVLGPALPERLAAVSSTPPKSKKTTL